MRTTPPYIFRTREDVGETIPPERIQRLMEWNEEIKKLVESKRYVHSFFVLDFGALSSTPDFENERKVKPPASCGNWEIERFEFCATSDVAENLVRVTVESGDGEVFGEATNGEVTDNVIKYISSGGLNVDAGDEVVFRVTTNSKALRSCKVVIHVRYDRLQGGVPDAFAPYIPEDGELWDEAALESAFDTFASDILNHTTKLSALRIETHSLVTNLNDIEGEQEWYQIPALGSRLLGTSHYAVMHANQISQMTLRDENTTNQSQITLNGLGVTSPAREGHEEVDVIQAHDDPSNEGRDWEVRVQTTRTHPIRCVWVAFYWWGQ